jgi:serine protease Do
VTSGIISATGRELGSGPYDDFLQVDAAINRGNSGGPTFNLDGEVVGVNTMIFSPSGGSVGIGFAISSNLAREIIADLADDGMISRGWLGVSIQSLNDNLAEALGLDDTKGALVSSVVAGSPAESAGLQEGDVIQRFDGEEVDKPSALSKIVASRDPGSENSLQIWRDGQAVDLTVELGILDDQTMMVASAGDQATEAPKLGLTLSPLNDEERQRLGLEDGRPGVVVRSVAPGSPAEQQEILTGDVILSIDNKSVATPGDVAELIDNARQEGRNAVAILMARDGQQLFKALSLAAS